jgi:sulfopyruvate decarboxylase TPP-binding subunit
VSVGAHLAGVKSAVLYPTDITSDCIGSLAYWMDECRIPLLVLAVNGDAECVNGGRMAPFGFEHCKEILRPHRIPFAILSRSNIVEGLEGSAALAWSTSIPVVAFLSLLDV